jgi:hypothetical protein
MLNTRNRNNPTKSHHPQASHDRTSFLVTTPLKIIRSFNRPLHGPYATPTLLNHTLNHAAHLLVHMPGLVPSVLYPVHKQFLASVDEFLFFRFFSRLLLGGRKGREHS